MHSTRARQAPRRGGRAPLARKRFGQHFLHDPAIIARLVTAIAPRAGEALVEIGPGRGALTEPLLAAAGALDVIEIDRDLAAGLRERHAGDTRLWVREADALKMDWTALAAERGRPLRVVGNLPYNISTPLLFQLLEHRQSLRDLHFMLQKEVVDRIVAAPGGGDYGRLSVMLSPFVLATRVLEFGPGAFQPPPRVRSALVRLTLLADPPPWATLPAFARVVALAFNQRRKTLRNALSTVLGEAGFAAAGIDSSRRPETLSPAEFGALALQLCASGSDLIWHKRGLRP